MKHYASIESESPIEIPLEEFAALSSSYIECRPSFYTGNYIGLEIISDDEADTYELMGALVQLLLQQGVNSFCLNFNPERPPAACNLV
jgi:hypothetical protein